MSKPLLWAMLTLEVQASSRDLALGLPKTRSLDGDLRRCRSWIIVGTNAQVLWGGSSRDYA